MSTKLAQQPPDHGGVSAQEHFLVHFLRDQGSALVVVNLIDLVIDVDEARACVGQIPQSRLTWRQHPHGPVGFVLAYGTLHNYCQQTRLIQVVKRVHAVLL